MLKPEANKAGIAHPTSTDVMIAIGQTIANPDLNTNQKIARSIYYIVALGAEYAIAVFIPFPFGMIISMILSLALVYGESRILEIIDSIFAVLEPIWKREMGYMLYEV